MLPLAPSTYYEQKAREKDPSRLPARAKRDVQLRGEIRRVRQENFDVYGVRKVWRQLCREGRDVARCTVARLMREMGLQGAVRGRRFKTTKPDSSGARPMDLVERDFNATRPNELWVSDLTYIATWRGFVYVAFVIDVFARLIVGWRATTSLTAGIALDALEQALHERRLNPEDPLVHHSDRGVQYVSTRYTERLAEAGIEPSVGSRGDSYDYALAESIIGLVTGQFKNFSASFDLDPSDLSTLKAKAVIDVASVDTEVEERDNHLRSGDFFDAENHPEMKFVSTKAEVVGDNKVKLHGNLTIRGVTKPVVLDAVYGGAVQDPWGNYRSAFSASGTINRKNFGVNWNKVLDTGGLVVGDEVQLELEAIRQDESSD